MNLSMAPSVREHSRNASQLKHRNRPCSIGVSDSLNMHHHSSDSDSRLVRSLLCIHPIRTFLCQAKSSHNSMFHTGCGTWRLSPKVGPVILYAAKCGSSDSDKEQAKQMRCGIRLKLRERFGFCLADLVPNSKTRASIKRCRAWTVPRINYPLAYSSSLFPCQIANLAAAVAHQTHRHAS